MEDHDGTFVEEFGVTQDDDDDDIEYCFASEDFELLGDYEIVNG